GPEDRALAAGRREPGCVPSRLRRPQQGRNAPARRADEPRHLPHLPAGEARAAGLARAPAQLRHPRPALPREPPGAHALDGAQADRGDERLRERGRSTRPPDATRDPRRDRTHHRPEPPRPRDARASWREWGLKDPVSRLHEANSLSCPGDLLRTGKTSATASESATATASATAAASAS